MQQVLELFSSGRYYRSGRLSQHLLWLACGAGVAGLLAFRALIALSPLVGVLAVAANPALRPAAARYRRNGAALRAAALVGFLLLSGFYTSEWATWRHELFRSLTWLGVPLAFTLAVPLSGRQRLAVGALFVLGVAAVGLATTGQYLRTAPAANEAIRVGQNMQAVTGTFHVAFGIMLAQAFFWGLLLRRSALAGRVLRGALLAAALGIGLTLHVLAYRTGLLVLYAGLLAYVGHLLVGRHLALGLLALGGLVLVPWLAYHTLGSVQQRVSATIYDVRQYTRGGDINEYSLARRLAAVATARAVIEQHWLLGVGPADAHAAMLDQYGWRDFGLRPENRINVHNQYLSTLVGGGLVGLALWLALLFGPLVRPAARRNPYVLVFIFTQATTMLVTDILSLQISLNLFVFGYGFLVVAAETDELVTRPQAAAATSLGGGEQPIGELEV
ncbi:O-antigen ligase family protein [Hymenobacter rubripertinctus]|uniref:O-antigen ligase domain-containing protein n=1 Tax=Hymenobacter rubripertinctus TaxID=2029981 RepID=A0A418R8Z0_9BACT|nr:O-antigen ligase family protein [Hymenobacter rubripertinctus]RIY13722.1 O-antigen ligase domain-containing protein [Hymenobacter rubripertinctus]